MRFVSEVNARNKRNKLWGKETCASVEDNGDNIWAESFERREKFALKRYH